MSEEDSIERIMDGRAWDEFCDGLKSARQALFRAKSPANAFDRAEGYRYLSRLTRLALEKFVENSDPLVPRFYELSREDAKIGADNPDAFYLNAAVSGEQDYRIWGTRGTAQYAGLGTYYGNYGSSARSGRSGYLDLDDIELAPDGSLEIILSSTPQEGNWLPMEPDTGMLIVRQFLLDKSTDEPAELHIERIGAKAPPVPLDPVTLDESLEASAAFVKGTADLFADWVEGYSERPNELNTMPDSIRDGAHAAPTQIVYHGYWKLAPNEVLVISTTPPECSYWNFQLDNYWMESLDYRYHPITVNKHSALLEDDGSLRIVIAHTDPGVPNWMDTAGHRHGTMAMRWNGAEDPPRPHCRVVSLASLANGR
ncbi:MAG: hypothetical protein CL908_24680 [Deltaproteobacteria bacterium]|nr:hypothetical protein [Deltaproteobacteria bacterium]